MDDVFGVGCGLYEEGLILFRNSGLESSRLFVYLDIVSLHSLPNLREGKVKGKGEEEEE